MFNYGHDLNGRTHPQSSTTYLQETLIPETIIRLIRDDLKNARKLPAGINELEMARNVMEDSRDFGGCIRPIVEEESDEE